MFNPIRISGISTVIAVCFMFVEGNIDTNYTQPEKEALLKVVHLLHIN